MNKSTYETPYDLFHDGILALWECENVGLRVDVEKMEHQKRKLTRRIKNLERVIMNSDFYHAWEQSKRGPINMYSPVQMAEYLYEVRGLEPKKRTATGKGSTDNEVLKALNIEELNTFLEIKKLMKLRDTYLDGFAREQVDGWLHPFFNLHIARSYRSSSNNPNFQNIPKRDKQAMQTIRSCLYPRKGHQLMELDYGQLEVRIAACYHNDPVMVKYINEGHDFHLDLARQIFNIADYDKAKHGRLRQAAKNGFVFPQFYGDYYKNCAEFIAATWCELGTKGRWKAGQGVKIGDETIADHMLRTGIRSYRAFETHLMKIEDDFWNNRFKVYAKWKEQWWRDYQKYGSFTSKTGFRYTGVMSRNEVINYPVQGAAFHVLLLAVIEGVKELREYNTNIVGQIHDAIVLDVDPDELEAVIYVMKEIMENGVREMWPWINVPLEIEAEVCPIDGSWAEKEDYKI